MTYHFANDRFTSPDLYESEYIVTVEYSNYDEPISYPFDNERKARAFAKEELRWETTKRVQCASLNIDQLGDFANLIKPQPVARFKLNDQHDLIVRKGNDGLTVTCDTCSLSATAAKAVIFAFENGIFRMMIDGANFKRI
jgi:hypothetical protein